MKWLQIGESRFSLGLGQVAEKPDKIIRLKTKYRQPEDILVAKITALFIQPKQCIFILPPFASSD